MALLHEPSDIAQMIVDKLKVDLIPYGFKPEDIYYGDRDPVNFPAVTVEVVDRKANVRYTNRVEYDLAAYLMVYYGRYDANETTRKDADIHGQNVVKVLNTDPQWKDENGEQRLVKAWSTRLEPGYARRNNAILYAARITWEAMSLAPL